MSDASYHRTFLALSVNKDTRHQTERIIQHLIHHQFSNTKVSWVPPKNLHITMHFIGKLSKEIFENLKIELKKEIEMLPPCRLEWNHLTTFPTHRPLIISIHTKLNSDLAKLSATIDQTLTTLRISERDRPFLPHMTIGRLKKSPPFSLSENQLPMELPKPQLATKLVLFNSVSDKHGTTYEPLAEFKFSETAQ